MKASGPIRGLIWRCSWLLRIISALVPGAQRKQWYERWRLQVWHWAHFLHESGRLNSASKAELAKHLRGSFSEAFWLRFDRKKVLKMVHERPRAARFCLLALAALFSIAVVASGFAPTIRSSFWRLPYSAPDRLAHLSFTNNYIRYHLDSLFLAVSRWTVQSKTAEAISAYSWEPATIVAQRGPVDVIGARVSSDFFDTLGVVAAKGQLFHSGDESQCANCIVISNALWQYGFHHDPAIIGKPVVFKGNASTVVGVLNDRFRFVWPEISVWNVGHAPAGSFTTAERTGVVLRLRPGVSASRSSEEFSQFVSATTGIDLTSLESRVQQGTYIYLLFTLLAFLGSLALLAYRLVNSSGPKVHLSLGDNYRWWMFFAVKTVLIVATCFLVSLEGTRRAFLVFTGVVPPFAGPVCTWLFLVTTILALSWSLHDQCRRCRICLKRLGHQAYVGAPASLLLGWSGTELVCSQGHGMLHVPEMPASWLDMEHWTPLDDSWKPLFEPDEAKVP
jgi:hypothetical protein